MTLLEAAKYFRDKLKDTNGWPIRRSLMTYRLECNVCDGMSKPSANTITHKAGCAYLQAKRAIEEAEKQGG